MQSFVRAVFALPALALLGTSYIATMLAPSALHAQAPLVAEAPIWGANNGFNGYAFLPVTIQGHKATVVINLNCTKCDLELSSAALQKAGITPPDASATSLGEITMGKDVQHNVPLSVNTKPTWSVPGPAGSPPVVGIVGVHFLTTHYDILYDFPKRLVTLYALPAKTPVKAKDAWLPEGFKSSDCSPMVDVPAGAATFTGMDMKINGHPVTGVIEMGPYYPKMNERALQVLTSPADSAVTHMIPPMTVYGNHVRIANVDSVRMTIGSNTFGAWNTEVLRELDVQQLLKPDTPIMLMNLSMLRDVRLFNSTSSKQACIAK